MAVRLFHYYCLALILFAGFWVLLVIPTQYFVRFSVIVTDNAVSSPSSSSSLSSPFITVSSSSRPRPTGFILEYRPDKLADSAKPADSVNSEGLENAAAVVNPASLAKAGNSVNLAYLADLERLGGWEDLANTTNPEKQENSANPGNAKDSAKLANLEDSEDLENLANLAKLVNLANPVNSEYFVKLENSEVLANSKNLVNLPKPENLTNTENEANSANLVNPEDLVTTLNLTNPEKSENSTNPVNLEDLANAANLANAENSTNLVNSKNLTEAISEESANLVNLANPVNTEDLANLANPVDSGKCDGKWIYLYELPPEFNFDLVRRCRFGITRWMDLCAELANDGLGQALSNSSLGMAWFNTDSYMLEVIFHYRMHRYPCRTSDPNNANAFFVPYYTGIDALPYLYSYKGSSVAIKDLPPHGGRLVEWLKKSPYWWRFGGRDHFLVMGRTSWDFDRYGNEKLQWGTGFSRLPEVRNMTALLIEKRPWVPNEQAVPYPTSFHPTQAQLDVWKSSVLSSPRHYLFAFAGSIRQTMMGGGKGMIRESLLRQCNESAKCCLIDCKQQKCSRNPEPIINSFLQSEFCLQPRGDTPTRRSTFDSLISGCIPVFFHIDSAYTQYTWHLPANSSEWSVHIAEGDVRQESVKVEEVLLSYSKEQIKEMREKAISLIPKLVYSRPTIGPGGGQEWFPDAFDTSIQGVLSRVARIKEEQSTASI